MFQTYILYRDKDGSSVTGTFSVEQVRNGTATNWLISHSALGYRQISSSPASSSGPKG